MNTSCVKKMPLWPEIPWSSTEHASGPRVLGINPWIHDFAAFNFWLRPVGLLACLDTLRQAGCTVGLVDCLDRTWRDTSWPKVNKLGAGHFPKKELAVPEALKHVERAYSRYGLPKDLVAEALAKLTPKPDLVFITCLMTYWYPGAIEAARLARELWPDVPVVLGGAYASLCTEHARAQGVADLVVSGPLEAEDNWNAVWQLTGVSAPEIPEAAGFSLALDLYPEPDYAPILGSRGCPFSCAYCASKAMYPSFKQKCLEQVWGETEAELAKEVRNFAFFDDALLVKPDAWLIPFLERLIDYSSRNNAPVQLHTPNAIHLRYLTPEICKLLRAAGLRTLRLGLESTQFQSRLDRKVSQQDWENGLANLLDAGFQRQQIGVYVLHGLPDQDLDVVVAEGKALHEQGLRPYTCYYTPIPGSKLFARAKEVSPYPIEEEPLFQNNSIWPCVPGGFSWDERGKWRFLAG